MTVQCSLFSSNPVREIVPDCDGACDYTMFDSDSVVKMPDRDNAKTWVNTERHLTKTKVHDEGKINTKFTCGGEST